MQRPDCASRSGARGSCVRFMQMRLTLGPSRRCGSGRELPTSSKPARAAAASSRAPPWPPGNAIAATGRPAIALDKVAAGGEFVGEFGLRQRAEGPVRHAMGAEFADASEVAEGAGGKISPVSRRPVAHDERRRLHAAIAEKSERRLVAGVAVVEGDRDMAAPLDIFAPAAFAEPDERDAGVDEGADLVAEGRQSYVVEPSRRAVGV